MTLRQKTLLITGIVLAVVVVLLYVVLRLILENAYNRLETEYTVENVQRAVNALEDDITALSTTVWDYARWDDSLAFVSDPDANQSYITDNWTTETFDSQRVDFVIYVNAEGTVVHSTLYDSNTQSQQPLPDRILEALMNHPELLRHERVESNQSGLLAISDTSYMVASRPIVSSLAVGPVGGALIWGRELNDEEVGTIAGLARLDLSMYNTSSANLSAFAREALDALTASGNEVWTAPLSPEQIAGVTLIEDLNDVPVLIAEVRLARSIYQQGQNNLNSLLLAVGLTGAVLIVATLITLEYLVLRPVATLSSRVGQIGSTAGSTGERLPVSGGDELDKLALEINQMLDRLDQSAAALRDKDQRLSAIFTSTPIALFGLDKGGTFMLIEGKGAQALGKPASEMLGQSIFNVYRATPVLIEQYMKALAGTPGRVRVEIDGVPLEIWQSPMKNDLSNTVGVIGVATPLAQSSS